MRQQAQTKASLLRAFIQILKRLQVGTLLCMAPEVISSTSSEIRRHQMRRIGVVLWRQAPKKSK
jgi:hypothetical protein